MKYDLLTEPWLPVVDRKGQQSMVGLLALFERAHELRTLVLETPDVTAGVYRMLLAILHRAYDGPKDLKREWRAIWTAKRFDMKRVGRYLDEWRARFDLWDKKHPFLQDPRIDIDEYESVSRLFVENAQGNNPTLFDHSTDTVKPEIDSATAARRLIGVQVMALGGGMAGTQAKGRANPFATSLTFLAIGDTVFETLCLNLLVYDGAVPIPSSSKDAPSWERDIRNSRERVHEGHLDLMTWRPRRYRLVPAEETGKLVRGVVAVGEADRFRGDSVRDPFAGYRVSKTSGLVPLRLDPDRAFWRDSLPFFAGDGELGCRPAALSQAATLVAEGELQRSQLLRLLAAGFAMGETAAKKRLGRVETVPIPAALLASPQVVPSIEASILRATEVGQAVNSAAFTSARHSLSAGERTPDTNEAAGLANATGARAVFWSEAGAAFPQLLIDLASNHSDPEGRWEAALRAAARRAFHCVEVKLGASARGFKALTLGQQTLHRRLKEIFPVPDVQEASSP